MCQRLDEDCGHVFLKCKFAKSVWREANLESIRRVLLECANASQTLEALLNLDDSCRLVSITLLWKIWSVRNSVNAGDRSPVPAAVASSAIQHTSEFTSYLSKTQTLHVTKTDRWTKPPADYLKINIDGSFCRENGTGGWGFCIRDYNGDVCGAGMGQIAHVADALQAETIACLKAIEYAAELGMGRIIIETDATLLKSALQSSEFDLSRHGVLFREAKFQLLTNFIDYKVMYCKRACNIVAHVLATNGASFSLGWCYAVA
jgi:ribonuclease HI